MTTTELSSMETPNGRATFEKVSPTRSLVWKEGMNIGSVEKIGRHWVTGDGRRFDSKKFAASALLWDAKEATCEHGRKQDEQCDACELIWIFNGK